MFISLILVTLIATLGYRPDRVYNFDRFFETKLRKLLFFQN